MDIGSVVELIQLATTENPRKAQSTQILDQLRTSPDRWNVGLSLFLDTQNETARFFGLSLVRDWMQCELLNSSTAPSTLLARERIRTSLMNWFTEVLKMLAADPSGLRNMNDVVPYYMSSNAVSVVTLSIKFDFPKLWPSAFSELQQLGYGYGLLGIELVTRVLKELEVEVVMFSETRSKAEIAQNTAVKDAMRESTIILDMVTFLCQGAKHALSAQRVDICAACLHCLSELISWVDAGLVVQAALPVVYEMWQQCAHSSVRYACCGCFYELSKKGMDPVAKVRLLHSIQLVPLLTQDARIAAQLSRSELTEDERLEAEKVSVLVDMLVCELLGCWSKYEDTMCGGGSSGSNKSSKSVSPVNMTSSDTAGDESQDIVTCIAVVVPFLQALLPLLMQCFTHPVLAVSSAALPACARLVALLRGQQPRAAALSALSASNNSAVFLAEHYLDSLLSGVYSKSQYPEDFDFEAAAEDELDLEVEAKSEVRKLFVNICRVRPDRCLDLLNAVMSAQPQPFSTAPYPPLEAALRLVHAFSECGPSHNKLLTEGTFPQLIRALQETDIAQHRHPQVLLVYFELSHRYIKHLSRDAILRVLQALLGRRGALHGDALVRGRAAYFALKICETQEGKNANVLESVYPQLSEILTEAASIELRSGFTKKSPVSEGSEIYLCEATALLTAHYTSLHNNSGSTTNTTNNNGAQGSGSELLRVIVDAQLQQMHLALCLLQEQPQLSEALCATLTRRMGALAGLSKGYSAKQQPSAAAVFETALSAVVAVSARLAHHKQLRGKILVYLHRMVSCIGVRILSYVEAILSPLLSATDSSDVDEVVQVLNYLMVEYTVQALPVVDALFLAVVDKYTSLSSALESSILACHGAAPHLHTERLALHRQYLLYVQHLATCQCAATLYTPAHLPRLQGILYDVVLQGLSGGAVASDPPATDTTTAGVRVNAAYLSNTDTADSVPVRKGALTIVNGLCNVWLLLPSGLALTPALMAASPAQAVGQSGVGLNAASALPPPPAEIAQAYRDYLLEHAVPRVMHSLSAWATRNSQTNNINNNINSNINSNNPTNNADRTQLNVKDAAAQSVLVEAAILLRSVFVLLNPQGSGEYAAYYTNLLRSLHWPDHRIQLLLQHLAAATPLGTFKDAFKLFIRECSN